MKNVVREMLTAVLDTHGAVTAVASVEAALAAWERERFDVLVSDLILSALV